MPSGRELCFIRCHTPKGARLVAIPCNKPHGISRLGGIENSDTRNPRELRLSQCTQQLMKLFNVLATEDFPLRHFDLQLRR
jgi:hypothetical protein